MYNRINSLSRLSSNKSIHLSSTNSKAKQSFVLSRTNLGSRISFDRPKKAASKVRRESIRVSEKKRIPSPGRLALSSGPKILVGLDNLGNTCFLNAVLQSLAHTPCFRAFFLSRSLLKSELTRRGRLSARLYKLFSDMKRSVRFKSLPPVDLKYLIGKLFPQFSGSMQQDAGEFLRALLQGLHEELNRIKGPKPYVELSGDSSIETVAEMWWEYSLSRDSSKITDLFQGQIVSIVKCSKCFHKSYSSEAFLDLTLPITQGSLYDCLEEYKKPCELKGYKCEKCKRNGTSVQSLEMYRAPAILVVQLKRFNKKQKVNTLVGIPEVLELNNSRFQLFASVSHVGTLEYGHYVADCLDGDEWYCFDDEKVKRTHPPGNSSYAYILFYSKMT